MPVSPYVPIDVPVHFKAVIYGRAGSGKTYFCGSSAAVGKSLFLNLEGGGMSIPREYRENMLTIDISNTPNQSAFDQLVEIMMILTAPDKPEWAQDIKTVILDSGSELQTQVLEQITYDKSQSNANHAQFDVWLEDYGDATSRLSHIFRMLRGLPYNVLITALQRENKVGDSNVIQSIMPEFTPKLANSICGYFDHVWCMVRTGTTTSVLTQPIENGVHVVKTRGTRFPQELGTRLQNPTFEDVYSLLTSTEG